MATPGSGLARDSIKLAYEARAAVRAPWEDESLPSSDDARYSQYLKFDGLQKVEIRRKIARSWIFLESFEWCYGRIDMVDNSDVLLKAIDYVESLSEDKQFISPVEYQAKVFTKWPANLKRRIPKMPADPRAQFLYHLGLTMPGWYSWAGGPSEAFTRWMKDGTQFGPSATLNCWEMVFYAAIKAGLVPKESLNAAYIAPKGKPEQILFDTFKKNITSYTYPGKPAAFKAGDIVISNLGTDKLHHVFAVTGKVNGPDDFKVVQLWGELGTGTTFYWSTFDFFTAMEQLHVPDYYVLRL